MNRLISGFHLDQPGNKKPALMITKAGFLILISIKLVQ